MGNLEKYYKIMEDYHQGKYGGNLTMHEILEQAGEIDLFDKMSISEVQVLWNEASGITKMMFMNIIKKKMDSNNS